MTTNASNEVDTAVTVFADDSIKELLKSGKIEDIQKIVQEGKSSLPVTASGFIQFLLGFQHFLVDAICITCLWGPVTEFCGNTPQGWGMLAAFISLYNVLAFCTQWLTGLWCDFLKNDRIMHIVAAVALILGAAACRLLPLYGVILIALGDESAYVDTLAYCHSQGFLHGDIRLNNLGSDAGGNGKLFDFGNASVIQTQAAAQKEIEMLKTVISSPIALERKAILPQEVSC